MFFLLYPLKWISIFHERERWNKKIKVFLIIKYKYDVFTPIIFIIGLYIIKI
jgi:hypothetical protein